jgi:hypothetical protein
MGVLDGTELGVRGSIETGDGIGLDGIWIEAAEER